MKVCVHCNHTIEEDAMFCPHCGNRISDNSKEKATCLHHLRRNLRHERKCWNIFGGVWLGFSIFFFLFSLLYIGIGVGLETPELALFSPIFFLYTILFLPIAIINLVMANKITGYLNKLDTDLKPAVERCEGIWLIVMGVLFNTIAMIFIIVNFVHVKSNRELLNEIVRDQQRL